MGGPPIPNQAVNDVSGEKIEPSEVDTPLVTTSGINDRPYSTDSNLTIDVGNYSSLQDALNEVPIHIRHFITVNIPDGSYSPAQLRPSVVKRTRSGGSGNQIKISGDTTTPTNVSVDHLTIGPVSGDGSVRVEGIEFTSTGLSRDAGLLFAGPGTYDLANCTFSAPAADNVNTAVEVRGNSHLSMDPDLSLTGEYAHILKAKRGGRAYEQSNSGSGAWTTVSGNVTNAPVNCQAAVLVRVERNGNLDNASANVTNGGLIFRWDGDGTAETSVQGVDALTETLTEVLDLGGNTFYNSDDRTSINNDHTTAADRILLYNDGNGNLFEIPLRTR